MESKMTQQKGIVKANLPWENSRAGFSISAFLHRLGTLSKLSVNNLKYYDSHPNPASDYSEAVQRIEAKITSEVDFYEAAIVSC